LGKLFPIDAAAWFGLARIWLGLAAVILIGLGSPAHSQILWQDDDDYPDFYIQRPPPPPLTTTQPRRARQHHRVATPEPDVKSARNPKGPVIVAISIRRQRLKLYDADGLFAETPISTGMPGHATPMGVFSVIQKRKWHRSNIYSDAPMPYMQRITWSGIAMHAGVLPGYPASHGCIRMPMSFAMKMWHWTKTGARVIITPGEVTPAQFSHPLLATHWPEPAPVVSEVTAATGETTNAEVTLAAVKSDSDTARIDDEQRSTDSAATSHEQLQPPAASVEADPAAIPTLKRSGRIAVFISGKDGRIYVRQNFEPVFDAPVTITASDRLLGTHVFTVEANKHGNSDLRWSVVSLPAMPPPAERIHARENPSPKKQSGAVKLKTAANVDSAADALNRISVPDAIMTKIASALSTGDSIIVSDQGIAGGETGEGTGFVVRLR
jgi:lipoprotein-anchoring transpeptidase ErfK/SrfK